MLNGIVAKEYEVRDGYEAKKDANAAELKTLLGTEWTFDIDPLSIYPYAPEGSYGNTSLGDCINASVYSHFQSIFLYLSPSDMPDLSYIEGFIYYLKYFIQYHGQEGVDELNAVCPTHTLTLKATTKYSYCGTEIADGKLFMLFHPNNLGTNINNVAEKLAETVTAAPQPEAASTLSYAARHSIKIDYTAKIGEYLEKARKLLENPEFKFEPEFEALGAKMKASSGDKDVRDDWETNIGSYARDYFSSLVDYLAYEKFGEDEMLREGLAEVAPKGVAKLRIVDKLTTEQNGYNEIILEDEALVLQVSFFFLLLF